MPLAVAAAQIAAARTVLPTSVSVPVTKTPRIARAGYSGSDFTSRPGLPTYTVGKSGRLRKTRRSGLRSLSQTVVHAAAHGGLVESRRGRRPHGREAGLVADDGADRRRQHQRGLLKL